jgi:hypothetical protein
MTNFLLMYMLAEKFRSKTFYFFFCAFVTITSRIKCCTFGVHIFCCCCCCCVCLINHKIFIHVENICPKYTALALFVIRNTPNSILNQNAVLKIIEIKPHTQHCFYWTLKIQTKLIMDHLPCFITSLEPGIFEPLNLKTCIKFILSKSSVQCS